MDFPQVNEKVCPTVTDGQVTELPEDSRCSDADFAAENPSLCPNRSFLILKPGLITVCSDEGTILFKAYTSDSSGETLAVGAVYATSDASVISINSSSGAATIVGPGIATISASFSGKFAFSQITVTAGSNCCDDVTIATAYVIDNSLSSKMHFDTANASRLAAAKKVAVKLATQLNDAKETAAVIKFNRVAETVLELTSVIGDAFTADTLVNAIESIAPTTYNTSVKEGMDRAINLLSLSSAGRKVIVLLSDGQSRPHPSLSEQQELLDSADAFKNSGGIIICVGLQSYGDGFNLLRNLASGGWFINMLNDAEVLTGIAALAGMQCYYCGGNRPLTDGYTCASAPPAAQAPELAPLWDPELEDLS